MNSRSEVSNYLDIFFTFLKLGMTSFGGPIAHLGYFHHEFVLRKKWIQDHDYAELVGLCQFLPGPASSQVGMALGFSKGGIFGAFLAWLGFTLPSAALLIAFVQGIAFFNLETNTAIFHGLKVVAVAVVAHAIWEMSPRLCPDYFRKFLALFAALIAMGYEGSLIQVLLILLGGLCGYFFLKKRAPIFPQIAFQTQESMRMGTILLITFFIFLGGLPLLNVWMDSTYLKLFDSFFRAGSLVFGGGHVILPLLEGEMVATGLVSKELFLVGYGAVQAVPGPLLSFAAFLGAVAPSSNSIFIGAAVGLVGIFLPSYLLIIGVLPFWKKMNSNSSIRSSALGINAVVVGLLISVFCKPIWMTAILDPRDFLLALSCFVLLAVRKIPSVYVVLVGCLVSFFVHSLS